ncbi:MAG: hypothetical protein WB422_00380, partial [Pseudolabrys sp.]
FLLLNYSNVRSADKTLEAKVLSRSYLARTFLRFFAAPPLVMPKARNPGWQRLSDKASIATRRRPYLKTQFHGDCNASG